jgi:pimeloyl-ACP methyl ester carboxylesterase
MKIDLTKLGLDFRAPVFLFEGRHDPYCPPSLIWDYYETIKAPYKEFIWFDNSGHFPFFEEKQKFADELFQKVLPVPTKNSLTQLNLNCRHDSLLSAVGNPY